MTNIRKKPLTLRQFNEARVRGDQPYERAGYVPMSRIQSDGVLGKVSKTFTRPGDGTKYVISALVWRQDFGSTQYILITSDFSTETEALQFDTSDRLRWYHTSGSVIQFERTTKKRFKDTGLYHIVCIKDTTQGIAGDRLQIFVNGVEITEFDVTVNPAQDQVGYFFREDYEHAIIGATGGYSKCEHSEIIGIDGYTPTIEELGEFIVQDGWVLNEYKGTYGGNGFHLKFDDVTDLGKDSSVNGNHWTVSGDVTQVVRPINDVVATLNILDNKSGVGNFSLNNRKYHPVSTTPTVRWIRSTLGFSAGKISFEFEFDSLASHEYWGIGDSVSSSSNGIPSGGQVAYASTGTKYVNGVPSAYGDAYIAGDRIRCETDVDGGTVEFFKNNISQGTIQLPSSTGLWFSAGQINNVSDAVTLYFSEEDWRYTPSPGFKELSLSNLPVNAGSLSDHFVQGVYVGNGTSQLVNFQDQYGDAVGWGGDDYLLIARNTGDVTASTDDWVWANTLRGTDKYLSSNDATLGEVTDSSVINSSDGTGFTVGSGVNMNRNTDRIAYHAIRAGSTRHTGMTTGAGVSRSYTASCGESFGMVVFTGNGAAGHRIPHHHPSGKTPKIITTRRLNAGKDWRTYASILGGTKSLNLNTLAAGNTDGTSWNNEEPDGSTFPVGTSDATNGDGELFIAFLFFETKFCRIFDYFGNASTTGPFINLYGKPLLYVSKEYGSTSQWNFLSKELNKNNLADSELYLNLSQSLTVGPGVYMNHQGVQVGNVDSDHNANASGYFGFAFVEPYHRHRLTLGQ